MKSGLYIEDFTDFKTGANIGEYFVKFPDMPSVKEIVNYGIAPEKQVFRRTTYEINGKNYYPSSLIGSQWKDLPDIKKKEIHSREWEYLTYGRWYYIGGKPIYINPFFYDFLNYYKPNVINFAQFWDSQWFYSLLMEDSFYNKDVLALLFLKGRRGGGTAINNGAVQHVVTTIKNSACGLMNYDIEQCKKVNFTPIKENILKLPDFRLPSPYLSAREGKTLKKLKTTQDMVFFEINNSIYAEATKEKGFDGTLQRLSVIDEPFKWANTDPMVTLEKNCLCIKDGGIKNNIKDIETGKPIMPAGLCVFVSSVDEISDKQIDTVNVMWDSAAPSTAIEGLCSTYGARRYFEPSAFGMQGFMDDYGFSMYEKASRKIDIEADNILKTQGFLKAREYRRKNPLCVEDALVPSADVCQFDFDILSKAYTNAKDMSLDDPNRPVFCQLEWIDYMKSVKVVPKPEYKEFNKMAKFCISGHPDVPNNSVSYLGKTVPSNKSKYLLTLDPVDYDKSSLHKDTRYSLPAMRVKRLLDMKIDGDKFDDFGNPLHNGYGFETNRTVMTYLWRPELTNEMLDDMCKIMIYYSAPLGHERNTTSIRRHLELYNMEYFMLDNKGQLVNSSTISDFGIKTSMESKRGYFDATRQYIERYGLAERHKECIEQLIKLTPENMTKNDLAAAYLIGEYIDDKVGSKYYKKSEYNDRIKEHFSSIG